MKNLFKALSEFQNEVPIIHKGTQGYGYSYSDLPTIFPVINPLLKKNGIGFTQLGEGKSIKTIVFHIESGETLESIFDIPQGVQLAKMNEFQVLGSAITYMRRYALSSALGIITDSDIDAAGEQIKVDHSKILSDISKINNESKLYEYHKQELKSTSNAAILELLNKRKLEINGK
jgi:hypothetical protein